jgi:hypothetical protein
MSAVRMVQMAIHQVINMVAMRHPVALEGAQQPRADKVRSLASAGIVFPPHLTSAPAFPERDELACRR